MSDNVASTSTSINAPTATVVNGWNRDRIKGFLQEKKDSLDLDDTEIDIIYNNKVDGNTFLELTREDLLSIGITLKPAKEIGKLISQIQGEQPVAGHVRTRSPSLNENSDTLKRKKRIKEYHDTVSIGLKANSPSVGANPENFFKDQKANPILNGRPLSNIGPPITLYNDAFSLFLKDFSDEDLRIPPDFLIWTDKLIREATDSYNVEEERNDKMRLRLSEKLGAILLVEYGQKRIKCKSDGVIMTNLGSLVAYLGVLEGKNEIGTGKNDPTIQGAIYYRDYWSQDNVETIRRCCCAPSFIITMAGPWFCILGGVFLNRAVVEPLTESISLTISLRVFNKKKRIARLFYSLFRALQHLRLFYQNLNLTKSMDQRFFPYVRQFQSNGAQTISFSYICELSDDPTRTIWKAAKEDGVMIVVKFTTRYCDDAHNICATSGFAPKLLYCSDNDEAEKLGGFMMIIMEYLDGATTLDQRFFDENTRTNHRLIVYRDVKTAIDALHNKDFVFADLRPPNIMIIETDDEMHANLIDFDWCGKNNLDRYPPSLNEDISWPPGAEPDALLKRAHDRYWLNELCKFLKLSKNQVTDKALSQL